MYLLIDDRCGQWGRTRTWATADDLAQIVAASLPGAEETESGPPITDTDPSPDEPTERPPAGWVPAVGPTLERYARSADIAADLLDPRNRFTIQVASYVDRASREVLAEESVAHLRANDVPAIGPLDVGGGLVVLAGAARSVADLAELRERIAELPDPRGRSGEYASALVRNIDDLVER